MRKTPLSLMLCAALVACQSNSTDPSRSGTPQMAHQREDAGESAILLGQADYSFLQAEIEDAEQMYSAASALAQAEGDVSTQVEALAQAARMLALQGDLEKGHEWLDHAVELARPEYPLGWSRTLIVRGVFAREEGRMEESASLFRQAYEFSMAKDLEDRAMHAAFLLASAGDREQRIEWTRTGIEFATKADLAGWLGPLWMNLGTLYMDSADHAQAVSSFEAARSAIAAGQDPETAMVTDYAYGVALRKAGRASDARGPMTMAHETAQERFLELRNKARMEWVGKTLRELGEIDLAEGAHERGIERMREAMKQLELAAVERRDPEKWAELVERMEEVEAEDRER